MICYDCNRRVGTRWVEVCPFCGNTKICDQNIEMRARIETGFAALEKQGVTLETMTEDLKRLGKL